MEIFISNLSCIFNLFFVVHVMRYDWFDYQYAPGQQGKYQGEVVGDGIWNELAFNQAEIRYDGYETTFGHILYQIETQGSYDVVVGFSAGGMALNMLTGFLLKKYPERPLPWKFCVLFSAYICRDNEFRAKYMGWRQPSCPDSEGNSAFFTLDTFNQPSLFVTGQKDDDLLITQLSTMLYRDSHQIIHRHGHLIPKDKHVVEEVCEEILSRCVHNCARSTDMTKVLTNLAAPHKPIRILCL